MRKSYKIIGIIVVVIVTTFAFIITTKQHNNKTELKTTLIPIKIGYRAHDLYAPLFIGLENGIFKKYGLKVEPIKFESTNQITDALIAGRIDASLGGVNTFLLFNIEDKSPGTFKIFSLSIEDSTHPSTAIVIPNSSTLKVSDLNNKKIASYLGSSIKIMYERFIKVNNLQNTTLIQMDPKLELPALEAGQVDAAFLLEPLVTVGNFKKISQPLESAIFDKYFMSDIPLSASIVSQKFINKQPEAIKQLIKATDEAIGIIMNNPDELRKILSTYTAIDPTIELQMPIAPFKKYNEMDKIKLQELSNLLLELGEIKNPINTEMMILPDKYVKDN